MSYVATNVEHHADILARALMEDRLVALIGAGASANYTDAGGREYLGMPTPSEFVNLCASQYSYIDSDMNFNRVCDEILDHEKRAGLEDLLLRYYRVPEAFGIPPAQRILSWLPFSLYITSNYDEFTERALRHEGKSPYVLIDNIDLIRKKQFTVPVIKYHGSVAKPSTIVAATCDYTRLDQERGLIAKYIATSLAGKVLLVIGHGLNDADLSSLIDSVLRDLPDYGPTIVALREPSRAPRLAHVRHPVEVVSEDLTVFLNRLLSVYRSMQHHSKHNFDTAQQWLNSAFFSELRQMATLPSETQVIDAFLRHLREEFYARDDTAGVLNEAERAISETLNERPNYGALKRIWNSTLNQLNHVDSPTECEDVITDIIEERTGNEVYFTKAGRNIVKANDRILVFSQSQRVLQVIKGASVNIQRTCHIFISECRPKSPQSYQDAEALCRALEDSYYKLTVCPDVVAINLIASHQVDKVILGTHALYYDDELNKVGSVHSYVNTCGSLAIDYACRSNDVPVYIIGEALKMEHVSKDSAQEHIDFHEENDLWKYATSLKDLRSRRSNVGHLNIGYDLVPTSQICHIVVPDV